MDRTTLALFTHELRNQCVYTEAAFSLFNQSLEQQAASSAFSAAQSILLSASQIGGLLWPPRARARKRGETFREALKLSEKHPLNDKRLLTIWEHADEKLDDWVGRTKGQQIVFDHIGPLSGMPGGQVPEANIYRLYDPTGMVFYYRGEGFNLQAIANAISDIYSRVNTLHRQFFPEQQQDEAAAGKDEEKAVKKPAAKKPAAKKKTKSTAKKSTAKKTTTKKTGKSKKAK
jgi:hypothetical protein